MIEMVLIDFLSSSFERGEGNVQASMMSSFVAPLRIMFPAGNRFWRPLEIRFVAVPMPSSTNETSKWFSFYAEGSNSLERARKQWDHATYYVELFEE